MLPGAHSRRLLGRVHRIRCFELRGYDHGTSSSGTGRRDSYPIRSGSRLQSVGWTLAVPDGPRRRGVAHITLTAGRHRRPHRIDLRAPRRHAPTCPGRPDRRDLRGSPRARAQIRIRWAARPTRRCTPRASGRGQHRASAGLHPEPGASAATRRRDKSPAGRSRRPRRHGPIPAHQGDEAGDGTLTARLAAEHSSSGSTPQTSRWRAHRRHRALARFRRPEPLPPGLPGSRRGLPGAYRRRRNFVQDPPTT